MPPMPFHMRPSGMVLYMRQKLGRSVLLKHARSPMVPINVKDVPRPAGWGWGGVGWGVAKGVGRMGGACRIGIRRRGRGEVIA